MGEALRDWLPLVVHGLTCWMSSEDILAGERWGVSVSNELMKSDYGLLILTKENLSAPWILFEAGALARAVGLTQVCPILVDVDSSVINGPLAQFQTVRLNKSGIWKLVRALYNANTTITLSESQQRNIVDGLWFHLGQIIDDRSTPHDRNPDSDEPRLTVIEHDGGREIHHHLSFPQTVQNLLNLLYRDVLGDMVPVYSYGETWILKNVRTGEIIKKSAPLDARTLHDVGIRDGDRLALIRLSGSTGDSAGTNAS
jgi:hypothetical protein